MYKTRISYLRINNFDLTCVTHNENKYFESINDFDFKFIGSCDSSFFQLVKLLCATSRRVIQR